MDRVGRDRVKAAIQQAQQRARSEQIAPQDVLAHAVAAVADLTVPTALHEILNATGVVLHTNAGRASLAAPARQALAVAAGYVDVELDLTTGRRSGRGRATLDALRAVVPTATDVLAVNNGAAALVLATTTLAAGSEVVVSRGEMVEIGDGFRLPDLIESTGARLREVGTTNRTKLADYADAVGPGTGAILKVHPSNFRVEGFTSAVGVAELAGLGVPVIADVGSGLLHPHPLLPDEPDVTTALADGAGIVTASGDKLLGGPQAGLIFGTTDLVQRLRRHPLARAVRLDKLTHAALEATLTHGHGPTGARPGLPTWDALTVRPEDLRTRSDGLAAELGRQGIECEVVPSAGAVGGGGAPGLELPGWAVALPEDTASALRLQTPAVLARVSAGRTLVDLRCVPPEREPDLARSVVAAVKGG